MTTGVCAQIAEVIYISCTNSNAAEVWGRKGGGEGTTECARESEREGGRTLRKFTFI